MRVLELGVILSTWEGFLSDTLPVENQSAVLHQKLLSHVGLGLDIVEKQPQHLRLKPNLFFSRFPPSFWTLLQRKNSRDCVILSIPKLSAQNHIAFVQIFLYYFSHFILKFLARRLSLGPNQEKGHEIDPCFVSRVENYVVCILAVTIHPCTEEHQSIFEVNPLNFPRTLCLHR